jgi:hypothetical protein
MVVSQAHFYAFQDDKRRPKKGNLFMSPQTKFCPALKSIVIKQLTNYVHLELFGVIVPPERLIMPETFISIVKYLVKHP